jgi:ATP-dependent DNA ligase
VKPPVEPMFANSRKSCRRGADYLYDAKWDSFCALVFCGKNDVYVQSRDSRPLERSFPDLHELLTIPAIAIASIRLPVRRGSGSVPCTSRCSY